MSNDSGRDEAAKDRPGSLEEFSERLGRMRGQGEEPPNPRGSPGAWGRAMRISSDLLAGVFVGCLLGLGLDRWLDTAPLFLLIGLGLGFAAGLRNMTRTLQQENDGSSER